MHKIEKYVLCKFNKRVIYNMYFLCNITNRIKPLYSLAKKKNECRSSSQADSSAGLELQANRDWKEAIYFKSSSQKIFYLFIFLNTALSFTYCVMDRKLLEAASDPKGEQTF